MEQFPPDLRYAFQRMWQLEYGTFRGVHVRDGLILLDPPFRVVRSARFSEAAAQKRSGSFPPRKEHFAFQRELVAIGDGVIEVIKVHDGLPVGLEIDEQL